MPGSCYRCFLACARHALQHHDVLHVIGVGEHVDRADALHAVAELRELGDVATLGARLAADVHHAPRRELGEVGDERHGRTGARRVHEHHVEVLSGPRHAGEYAARVTHHELGSSKAVHRGVGAGVLHRIGVALHAQ